MAGCRHETLAYLTVVLVKYVNTTRGERTEEKQNSVALRVVINANVDQGREGTLTSFRK